MAASGSIQIQISKSKLKQSPFRQHPGELGKHTYFSVQERAKEESECIANRKDIASPTSSNCNPRDMCTVRSVCVKVKRKVGKANAKEENLKPKPEEKIKDQRGKKI